jgi:hypothetical protein
LQEEIKQKSLIYRKDKNDNYTNENNDNISMNNNSNEEKEKNNKQIFNDSEIKLIYQFSDSLNLKEIYPAFSKISDMTKNFSDDIIEYLRILKNNELYVHHNLIENSIVILIPEVL